MLLQSYNGRIRVFPAVPADWVCRFADLRAVGAFLVTSEIAEGEVKYIVIESLAGQPCAVVNPWPGREAVVLGLDNGETPVKSADKLLEFGTIKGASYSVTRADAPLDSFPRATLSGSARPGPRLYAGPRYLGDKSKAWTVTLGKTNN